MLPGESKEEKYHSEEEDEKAAKGEWRFICVESFKALEF